MEIILRFGLFLLSMSGYLLYITKKYQIRMEFAPILFCAWTSNLLYVAGILNVLPHTAWLLFAGGFFCLFRFFKILLISDTKPVEKGVLMRYVVFLCILIYFFRLLYGAHFTSYDNFSHWATVVKNMLLQDRMPNFEDAVIRFQSYPLGSSLFLYYVCKMVGVADGCMLWAQLVMLASCLFALTAFIRSKNIYQVLVVLLSGIWALSVNNSIYELRVDTLLPLAGVAAFAILYKEKEQPAAAMYASMGILILLVNIKNSGIFFYLACILFFAISQRKELRRHKTPFFTAGLLAPLSALFLWKRHVAFAFSDGMSAKHSMNIAHFGEMAAKKTADDILGIGVDICRRFTDIGNIEVKLMLFATLFVLLLAILFYAFFGQSGQWKKMLCLLAAVWGCFALYTGSVYAMYVFSMPMGESAHLASYDRYILSVLIFLYGIITVVVMDTWNALDCQGISGKMLPLAALLFAFCLAWQVRQRLDLLLQPPDFAHTKRCHLQQLMQRDGIAKGDSVFLYVKGSDDDVRYFFYLTRYELWTNDVLVVHEENFAENRQKIRDYDYLIIWDADENTDQYLQTHDLGAYCGMNQIGIAK